MSSQTTRTVAKRCHVITWVCLVVRRRQSSFAAATLMSRLSSPRQCLHILMTSLAKLSGCLLINSCAQESSVEEGGGGHPVLHSIYLYPWVDAASSLFTPQTPRCGRHRRQSKIFSAFTHRPGCCCCCCEPPPPPRAT